MTTRMTWVLMVLGCLSGCATVSPAEQAAAVSEQNKQRARLFAEEVYNQKRFDRISEYVAADFVDHSAGAPQGVMGPAVVRQQAEASFATFPDLKFDILHLVADGDLVSMHWQALGTDTKAPADPTGKPRQVTLRGQSLLRMREGRVVESWDITDRLDPLLQRGYKVIPPGP